MTSNNLHTEATFQYFHRIGSREDKGSLTLDKASNFLCNGYVTKREKDVSNVLINHAFLCNCYVGENIGVLREDSVIRIIQ